MLVEWHDDDDITKQFKPWKLPAVVGSIVVVGVLTRRALLTPLCYLKAGQMNIQRVLIRKLILYEFKLGYNERGEGGIASSTVTRCLLDDQARSGRSKTLGCEAVLKVIKQIRWGVQGEYQVSTAIHSPVCFVTFTTSAKTFKSHLERT